MISSFVRKSQMLRNRFPQTYRKDTADVPSHEYIQFLYYALGSMAETMTRAIGLKQTSQIPDARFDDLDLLHYEVENRLLRLIEKLEQKRDDGDWIARIAEDPEEYIITPPLHHSNTPSLSTPCINSGPCSRARCAAISTPRSHTS